MTYRISRTKGGAAQPVWRLTRTGGDAQAAMAEAVRARATVFALMVPVLLYKPDSVCV